MWFPSQSVKCRIRKFQLFRGRVLLYSSLCLSLLGLPGCGLTNTDPEKLFDNAVSGLSGKDNFAFTGVTQLSLNGMPPQQGISFKGTVTGHNQLQMQVVPGEQGGSVALKPMSTSKSPKSGEVNVQFNRTQGEWIVSESPGLSEVEQLVRWNPLAHLERLNVMKKQVSAGKGSTVPGLTVLSVSPDSSAVSSMLQSDLNVQLQSLDPELKLKELQQKLQLTAKQTAAMRPDIEKSLTDARKKIEEMKASLKAQSTYQIGVERRTSLPKTMEVTTVMHYTSAGVAKEETTQVHYTFGD